MEIINVKSYPGLMSGKKILYVHGFGSSGQSGTVERLRRLMPSAEVVAPDLPIHPAEAMTLLETLCRDERPDLIIGTSMGGMYAEMLTGYDRILFNPAFRIADDILKHNMLGKVTFYSERRDGLREFMMTKQLQAEFQEVSAGCFAAADADGEQERVWGLFGLEDNTVDTYGLFAARYRHALHFHGGHRMNDSALMHSVLPVVRRIDDRQNGRQRGIVYISVEQTMERDGRPLPSMLKAYRLLTEHYDVYVVAALPDNDAGYAGRMQEWVFETLGVAAYRRLVLTNRKDLLYGDYLIDALEANGSTGFMSTRIDFGSDTFKTWDDVIELFGRLGGQ